MPRDGRNGRVRKLRGTKWDEGEVKSDGFEMFFWMVLVLFGCFFIGSFLFLSGLGMFFWMVFSVFWLFFSCF